MLCSLSLFSAHALPQPPFYFPTLVAVSLWSLLVCLSAGLLVHIYSLPHVFTPLPYRKQPFFHCIYCMFQFLRTCCDRIAWIWWWYIFLAIIHYIHLLVSRPLGLRCFGFLVWAVWVGVLYLGYYLIYGFICLLIYFWFFQTGFLYVALAVLEFTL